MRVLTDDGKFGFLIAPLAGRGMFRFQIVLAGQLIGDAEPSILGPALQQLERRPNLTDKRLSQPLKDPARIMSILRFDEDLHDPTMLSFVESLDRWLVYGYVYEKHYVMLAQAYGGGATIGPVLVSVVDVAEYDAIVDVVCGYWSKVGSNAD
jgi:hypothetical protein